jgi:hypothetical protein
MNSPPRSVDRCCTFFSPSIEQKRLAAKGRSPEMTNTTVFVRPAAFSLNLRVDVAQVGVSRLGTMLRILRLPVNSSSCVSASVADTSENLGALSPTLGKRPSMLIGLPPRVTVLIVVS